MSDPLPERNLYKQLGDRETLKSPAYKPGGLAGDAPSSSEDLPPERNLYQQLGSRETQKAPAYSSDRHIKITSRMHLVWIGLAALTIAAVITVAVALTVL